MASRLFNVDFERKQGKIKPLGCINGGPLVGGAMLPHDMSAEYSELKIPFVRCVMPDGSCGYNQFICVHSIFPDFSLDEEDENSYNFGPTDRYLSKVRECGASIFYTLGETAEPYGRPIYAKAPSDAEKWARVCEHIVMHYNEGWADGYKWNIKYFEIWNGADREECFSDDRTRFFELYRLTANRLKERFPRIKIGGYGSMGFAALNRISSTDKEREAIEFMQKFFSYIRKEETSAPLDFFTWKCCASTPEELMMHAKYARAYLDNAGLKRTKSVVAEFNLAAREKTPSVFREEYPAQLASALILAQKSSVDMLFYSSSEPHDVANALYTVDDGVTHRRYASFEILESFAEMRAMDFAVETGDDLSKEAYLLASRDSLHGVMMLSVRDFDGRMEIYLKGSEYGYCSVKRITSGADRGEGRVSFLENLKIVGDKIVLSVKRNEIYVISLN